MTNDQTTDSLALGGSKPARKRFTGTRTTPLPFSCRKCGQGWSGYGTSHCATCHRTFTGVSGFDKHRTKGYCVNPATAGLTTVDRGRYLAWGTRADVDADE